VVRMIGREAAGQPVDIGPITLTRLQPNLRSDGGRFDAMRIEMCGKRTTIDTYEGARIIQTLQEWLLAATGVTP
jgi:hypothetical protein